MNGGRAKMYTTLAITLSIVIAVLSICQVSAAVHDEFGVLEWIRSTPGGYIHPHQEFRKIHSSIGEVRGGMFATARIPRNTILAKIPRSILIQSDPSENGDAQMSCGMVRSLARELKLGNKSRYAPFANFVLSQQLDHIPSNWSPLGKKILVEITGETINGPLIPPLEATEWLDLDWFDTCKGDPDDLLSAKAALFVVQWNDEGKIIPISGFYGHRNGNWTNAAIFTDDSEGPELRTTRDIARGEQIYQSFNRCPECGGRQFGFGTAEIFRDSGFVEDYPQCWHFLDLEYQFTVDVDEKGDGYIIAWELEGPNVADTSEEVRRFVVWLKRQIRRLHRLRNIDYQEGNPGMHPREWESAWHFVNESIQTMNLAILALEHNLEISTPFATTTIKTSKTWPASDHYDHLEDETDDTNYLDVTCDDMDSLEFRDHCTVEYFSTPYQIIDFSVNPVTRNVALSLDGVVQIASVYRPQYHEYMVHTATRFLDSVARVIFIGGGDSMLLHEILKYPDLELVVGLELDQSVVRQSFKYFHTQPHFDDPRVEWWFGDATKTLLLLPAEYWQSFDLVLVDLSETVMSMSVTVNLDVFDALALLLKPTGIMVKNEYYMKEFNEVFDNVMQMLVVCPIICDQNFVLGSNGIDFLHTPLKDHGTDNSNLLYKPMAPDANRLEHVHDYKRNYAREQGKCGDSQEKRNNTDVALDMPAGVLQIIDAEKIATSIDATLLFAFQSAIERQGFKISGEKVLIENKLLFFMLDRGYVLARHIGDNKKHCSLDIHLWGGFHKLRALSIALTNALESGVVSSYRVVVGGMHGSLAQLDEKESVAIGPQIVPMRNCQDEPRGENPLGGPGKDSLMADVILETLNTFQMPRDGVAVAFCGLPTEECLASSILSSSNLALTQMFTCSRLNSWYEMHKCEVAITSKLLSLLGDESSNNTQVSLLAVDANVPYEMLQILNSILSQDDYREALLDRTRHLVMAWSNTPKEEPWRHHFLDRYRRQHMDDPVYRAKYRIQCQDNQTAEFGVVSAGDDMAVHLFAAMESQLREHFLQKYKHEIDDMNLQITLDTISGGKYAYWDPYNPKEFSHSDYDEGAALSQFFEQKPLAHHVVARIKVAEGKHFDFNTWNIKSMLQTSLKMVGIMCEVWKEYNHEGLGEGLVLTCFNPKLGSVILTWNGQTHIEVSCCLYDVNSVRLFVDALQASVEHRLIVGIRDDMPRGIGRVVSLPEDTMTPEEMKGFFESLHDAPRRGSQVNEDDDISDEDETVDLNSEMRQEL